MRKKTSVWALKKQPCLSVKKGQKPGDAHGRPVEKSTAHPPGPVCILRRRPPARPEQKNETDAHPPIGRVSQIGRVGARPALSVVLAANSDAAHR